MDGATATLPLFTAADKYVSTIFVYNTDRNLKHRLIYLHDDYQRYKNNQTSINKAIGNQYY